ncbi:hypothetical protein DYI37_01740 [Fulvimarina endophytica]|uniref:Uncharacterized protein n=1 Tax=Fulvimarina endophytica TaxID=2293836 RepID=A0A371XAK1_9HYPH|nr:hypothetical protein [Fulvimarina endophytica]RFC66212.1 hypothetical protein DYI37_01740 [Fulvimarina endophytica]
MLDLPKTELDEIIQAEKKQVALEYHNEAWADGISEGIESEILAETALSTAMTELVRLHGETHALDVLESLRRQVEFGVFRQNPTLQ